VRDLSRRLLAGALLVGLWAAAALGQDRIESDRYANARYGIEIRKPAAWYFITASAVLDQARKAAAVPPAKAGEDPVKVAGFAVVVSKVPSLGRAFDPQVIVLVHELAHAPTGAAECEKLRTGMTDPQTVKPTREVRLEGRPAVRLDFQGLVDGDLVRATALCTFKDRQAFVVVGQALATDFDGEAETFETILGSFRLK